MNFTHSVCFGAFFIFADITTDLLSIVIIGSGKLATGLAGAIAKTDCELLGIWSRNTKKGELLAKQFQVSFFRQLAELPLNADLYLLAVSDNAISEVAQALPAVTGIVCHCSGGKPLDDLKGLHETGVLWPIQSFTGGSEIDFSGIPLAIESESEENLRILEAFADRISHKVFRTNSEQRPNLHLAAVLVNNFPNLLYTLANDFLRNHGEDLSLFLPLMQESISRLNHSAPDQVQTGPAIRRDSATIQKHLDLLAEYPNLSELYALMTRLIQQRFDHGNA